MYTPKERRSLGGKPSSKNNEAYIERIGTEFADSDRNQEDNPRFASDFFEAAANVFLRLLG